MTRSIFAFILWSLFQALPASCQSDCEPKMFGWEHLQSAKEPVRVKCSDSSQDYILSIAVESHDWELPQSTLNAMSLEMRYETYYQLSLSRGTFRGFVEEVQQALALSDVDLVLVLVDLVRELPYLQTVGGEQSPETTLALGRGDCSDKSLLLATLFGELGIETHLVLDDVKQHAFLAFPADQEGEHIVLETTSPMARIFEEKRLEEGQIVVQLSPGEAWSESQYNIMKEVLRWQSEWTLAYGPLYIFGDCETRQRLLQMASLEARRDSMGQEIDILDRQLDSLTEERNTKVAAYNVLTEEINEIIRALNEWSESTED